jgi:hypothetical protein
MPNAASVILTLQSQVAPQISQAANAYKSLSVEEQKAEQGAARYAQTLQKVALADSKTAVEEQRLAVQTANAARAQDQASLAALRLASAQEKAGNSSSLAGQFADGLKSGLLGIVGPAALATAALAIVVGTANSFKEAFTFKAQLDSTNASIAISLQGIRDSGAAFQEAAQFANRYKLTQEETAAAIQASIPILRTSNASLTAVESTLLRLQAKKPEKSIADAARALDELKSGQIVSIVDQFNVSRDAANKMKDEIAGGADAVTVLSQYLETAGFGMEALEIRTRGATGALNDAKVAQEELKIAQGRLAESAGGVFFVEAIARQYRGLANLLNGDAIPALRGTAQELQISAQGALAYATALASGKSAVEAQAAADQAAAATANSFADAQRNGGGGTFEFTTALKANADALSKDAVDKLNSSIATAQLAQQQAQLEADSRRAAQGLLGAGDQALLLAQKYGIAADQAQFLIRQQQALSNASALADQRVGERDPSNTLSASEFNKFDKAADAGRAAKVAEDKKAADKAAADAKRLQDAQDNLALSRAKTSAQKIAVYRAQLARTTDQVERLQIQAQIEQEQRSGGGKVTAAQSTALKLNDIARTSGDDRLKIERENLERLRDQQEDFDVRSARSKEDFERQKLKLLAEGKRADAAALTETFARDQRRDQEDFERQKRRTVRNNQENLGDQSTRVDNRVESINARTAARGGTPSGLPSAPGASTPAPLTALPAAPRQGQQIAQLTIVGQINMDSKAVGTAVYPTIAVLIDDELSASLALLNPPGSGQAAVAGVG